MHLFRVCLRTSFSLSRTSLAVCLMLFVSSLIASPSLAEDHDTAVMSLFDGTDMSQWRGYKTEEIPAGWSVQDGTLHRHDGGGDIMTKDKFDDFELTLEWKVAEGGNSGIMYRVRTGDGAPYVSGPEYQILDNERHADGKSLMTSAGSLYGIYPAKADSFKPAGEWNTTKIIVKGNHVEHWLNGVQICSTTMWGDDWNERFGKSKFKDWEAFGREPTGHIALQDHGDLVWYRNIRVKRLGDHHDHGHHKHEAAAQ